MYIFKLQFSLKILTVMYKYKDSQVIKEREFQKREQNFIGEKMTKENVRERKSVSLHTHTHKFASAYEAFFN